MNMGYVAPRIEWDGDKFDNHKPGETGYGFTQIPNPLLAYVMRQIPGKCGNRLKLMVFLMGCGEGFEIHEKTVLQRTGMSQSAYSEARKWLDAQGFISYKPGSKNPKIKVNYALLWSLLREEELESYIEQQEEAAGAQNDFPSGDVVIGSQFWTWDKYNALKETDYFESQGLNRKQIEAKLKEYLPIRAAAQK